jgi:hypothetical protein
MWHNLLVMCVNCSATNSNILKASAFLLPGDDTAFCCLMILITAVWWHSIACWSMVTVIACCYLRMMVIVCFCVMMTVIAWLPEQMKSESVGTSLTVAFSKCLATVRLYIIIQLKLHVYTKVSFNIRAQSRNFWDHCVWYPVIVWGFIVNNVYVNSPASKEQLKVNIQHSSTPSWQKLCYMSDCITCLSKHAQGFWCMQ